MKIWSKKTEIAQSKQDMLNLFKFNLQVEKKKSNARNGAECNFLSLSGPISRPQQKEGKWTETGTNTA